MNWCRYPPERGRAGHPPADGPRYGQPAWLCRRHLAEHGEGLFLLSFGVDSLADASAAVEAGGGALSSTPRTGLDGWQVVDLDPESFAGARLQLTEEPGR